MKLDCIDEDCDGHYFTEDSYPSNEECKCTLCGKVVTINFDECYIEGLDDYDPLYIIKEKENE